MMTGSRLRFSERTRKQPSKVTLTGITARGRWRVRVLPRSEHCGELRAFRDVSTGPPRSTILAQKLQCKVRGRQWLPPRHWGHTPHVRDFLESVQSNRVVPVAPREARRSLELAVALYSSALTGERVSLPLDKNALYYRGISSKQERGESRTLAAG